MGNRNAAEEQKYVIPAEAGIQMTQGHPELVSGSVSVLDPEINSG